MPSKLQKLAIEEVSGVEHPANELPGWLVMKTAGKELTPEDIEKEVDRAEADFAILYASLETCDDYLEDAPEEVRSAADTLRAYIEDLFGEGDSEQVEPEVDTEPGGEPLELSAKKSKGGLLARLRGRRDGSTVDNVSKENENTPAEDDEVRSPGEIESDEETKSPEAPDLPEERKDEPEETPAVEETKDEEPDEEAPEAEEQSVEKSVGDAVTKALGESPVLKEIGEGQTTLAKALDAALDRIGKLEARQIGVDPGSVEKSKEDGGQSALSAGLGAVARGGSITLT